LGSAEARIKRLSLGKDISNNIWATFDLSYQKLNTKEKEIFRLLGGAWAKGATVKLLAGAMETQLTDYDSIDSGLRGLAKRALVRTESIGEYKRYLMHNLVQDFAQSLIVDSGQTITELRLKWLTSVVTYVNYYCEDSPDNHTHLELELDNLLGAAAWAAEMGKWTEVDQIAIAMHEKSGFILRRGYASRAVGLLQLAREAAQNLGDKSHEGLHTGNLGMAFFEISDYTQALECYKKALDISRELGDKTCESRWLGSIGFVNDSLSRYSEAIKCYEGAIQIDREIGNQKGVGKWLGSAAGAYRLIGNSEKAVQYYEEAIQIARQMNDKVTEAVHLSNLGNAHRSWGWGNFEKAIECYSQAIQIARDTGDIMTEARATINSARVKSWLGNSEPALIELDHGLDLFTQIGFRSGQAYSHGYKGEIYRALGKQTEAKFETELALTIHKEVHVLHGQSDWLNNLGVWAGQDSRVEEGIHFLEEALEIRKKLGLAKVAETEMALKKLSDLLCKNLEKANE
ncbi:MAG: tetratricopeptide repeat protein, partial [Thermoplasmata archaeon]|nr:tetratricopeptide repeat protein [Thermoplasmata archaeon]